jgi:hypothetical protein
MRLKAYNSVKINRPTNQIFLTEETNQITALLHNSKHHQNFQ